MKKGFEEEFDIELVEGVLTDYELNLTEKFEKEHFHAKDWNFKR